MITADVLSSRTTLNRLIVPTVIITLFTLAGQVISFATQVVIAAAFGARADMDAFLAATTLPQYVIAVLLTALGFVFIPLFVEHAETRGEDDAWRLASGVITLVSLMLGGLAIVGILFAKPLLRLTTPGLSPESLHLASRVARITWPTIVATGLVTLLSSIYQARGHFRWPAAVPVIGALLNLGLVVALAPSLGVVGIAIAAAASLLLQTGLLLPIASGPGRYRPVFNWRHPGVQQLIHLLLPLVLSGLLVRWTPIIDRYLASGLSEGAISHLSYAFKILGVLGLVIATGVTTVVFPRMALDITKGDTASLRHTLSVGLRVMWLAVAPVMTIGAALALPLVRALFQRGAFAAGDAQAVASLLKVYLLSLAAMCVGNITGRTFYVLKDTRTIAVIGVLEALAYAVYTPFLARRFGVAGVAWAYVLYFNLSLSWHVGVLRYRITNFGGDRVLGSLARTGLAAVVGGVVAWAMTMATPNLWLQFLLGGILGLAGYAGSLLGLGSAEGKILWGVLEARIRGRFGGLAPVASASKKRARVD